MNVSDYEKVHIGEWKGRLPSLLCTDEQVFDEIFSLNTWKNVLTQEQRERIIKHLPKEVQSNDALAESTIEDFFSKKLKSFHEDPLSNFFQQLKLGKFDRSIVHRKKCIRNGYKVRNTRNYCSYQASLLEDILVYKELCMRLHGRSPSQSELPEAVVSESSNEVNNERQEERKVEEKIVNNKNKRPCSEAIGTPENESPAKKICMIPPSVAPNASSTTTLSQDRLLNLLTSQPLLPSKTLPSFSTLETIDGTRSMSLSKAVDVCSSLQNDNTANSFPISGNPSNSILSNPSTSLAALNNPESLSCLTSALSSSVDSFSNFSSKDTLSSDLSQIPLEALILPPTSSISSNTTQVTTPSSVAQSSPLLASQLQAPIQSAFNLNLNSHFPASLLSNDSSFNGSSCITLNYQNKLSDKSSDDENESSTDEFESIQPTMSFKGSLQKEDSNILDAEIPLSEAGDFVSDNQSVMLSSNGEKIIQLSSISSTSKVAPSTTAEVLQGLSQTALFQSDRQSPHVTTLGLKMQATAPKVVLHHGSAASSPITNSVPNFVQPSNSSSAATLLNTLSTKAQSGNSISFAHLPASNGSSVSKVLSIALGAQSVNAQQAQVRRLGQNGAISGSASAQLGNISSLLSSDLLAQLQNNCENSSELMGNSNMTNNINLLGSNSRLGAEMNNQSNSTEMFLNSLGSETNTNSLPTSNSTNTTAAISLSTTNDKMIEEEETDDLSLTFDSFGNLGLSCLTENGLNIPGLDDSLDNDDGSLGVGIEGIDKMEDLMDDSLFPNLEIEGLGLDLDMEGIENFIDLSTFLTDDKQYSSFFSLIRDVICSTKDHRSTLVGLQKTIKKWSVTSAARLNSWFNRTPDWHEASVSALNFLAGNYPDVQPEDFVPYIEYKYKTKYYQWIGAGRDGDNNLSYLCNLWLDNLHKLPQLKKIEGEADEHDDEDEDNEGSETGGEDAKKRNKRVATPPPPRFRTDWSVRKSSEEEKKEFQSQERKRFDNPHKAFTYKMHGYESVVGPVKGVYSSQSGLTNKARGHSLLVDERPPYVTILALVRDSVARLPNGEGTRSDICELLRDSAFLAPEASSNTLNSVVSGALDRLHYERDPCVRYDSHKKNWIYLHRDRTQEQFERIHHNRSFSKSTKSRGGGGSRKSRKPSTSGTKGQSNGNASKTAQGASNASASSVTSDKKSPVVSANAESSNSSTKGEATSSTVTAQKGQLNSQSPSIQNGTTSKESASTPTVQNVAVTQSAAASALLATLQNPSNDLKNLITLDSLKNLNGEAGKSIENQTSVNTATIQYGVPINVSSTGSLSSHLTLQPTVSKIPGQIQLVNATAKQATAAAFAKQHIILNKPASALNTRPAQPGSLTQSQGSIQIQNPPIQVIQGASTIQDLSQIKRLIARTASTTASSAASSISGPVLMTAPVLPLRMPTAQTKDGTKIPMSTLLNGIRVANGNKVIFRSPNGQAFIQIPGQSSHILLPVSAVTGQPQAQAQTPRPSVPSTVSNPTAAIQVNGSGTSQSLSTTSPTVTTASVSASVSAGSMNVVDPQAKVLALPVAAKTIAAARQVKPTETGAIPTSQTGPATPINQTLTQTFTLPASILACPTNMNANASATTTNNGQQMQLTVISGGGGAGNTSGAASIPVISGSAPGFLKTQGAAPAFILAGTGDYNLGQNVGGAGTGGEYKVILSPGKLASLLGNTPLLSIVSNQKPAQQPAQQQSQQQQQQQIVTTVSNSTAQATCNQSQQQ